MNTLNIFKYKDIIINHINFCLIIFKRKKRRHKISKNYKFEFEIIIRSMTIRLTHNKKKMGTILRGTKSTHNRKKDQNI